jgi:PKD repeat protein
MSPTHARICIVVAQLLPVLTVAGQSVDVPFPDIRLAQGARGQGIIAALGNNLPAVAKYYGMAEHEFRALCQRDNDVRIDLTGRLFYGCEGTVAKAPTAQNAGTGALLSYPASQTFLLHSKPGAGRVIYLDFNGHTTSGTNWKSGASFTSPAYDVDGNPAAFSTTELANIQEIWKRVSEDYSPWEVDVTTAEPTLEGLRRTSVSDTAYGIRMVIGGSSYDWYGAGAGGVAYVGSFSWNTDTPAYVFTAQLGNGFPKYVAEATSHEAGHTVGLNHDGVIAGAAYYGGHNGWAPIMGVGYSASVTQFSRGEYLAANNLQDDIAVIETFIPRSTDLAGDDILHAVPLTGTSVNVTGIIGTRADADLYRVDAGAGVLTFNAAPAAPDANLDISLSLYNGSGNLVTSSNPAGLAASLTCNVSSGTYYLAVEGVGTGLGVTAYTDYASLGQFTLTGAVPLKAGKPPVAVITASTTLGRAPLTVRFTGNRSSDPEGSALRYDWDFGDATSSTQANPTHIYALPGTYVASLVVFDSTGLSGSASTTITVRSPANVMYVSRVAVSSASSAAGTLSTATVQVKDMAGNVKPNVAVTGKWSGATSGSSTGTTGASGTVTLNSGWTRNRGAFTFTVTGLSLNGVFYDASLNTQVSGTAVR